VASPQVAYPQAKRPARSIGAQAADSSAAITPGDVSLLQDPEKGGPDWQAAKKELLAPKWVELVDKVRGAMHG
jgi:hypothetical protein